MKMKNGRKRTGTGLVLMILGAALVLAGAVMTLRLPADIFEYALPAPAPAAGAPVRTLLEKLDDILAEREWTAALRTQDADVSDPVTGRRTAVTVYAVGEGYFDLHHETPSAGQLLSADDIRTGRNAAVINRSCAEALFPGKDPTGQKLTCGGMDLEIIGVTAGSFRPGETGDAVAWIPLAATDTADRQGTSTLEVRVTATSRAEQSVLKNLLAQWSPGGTTLDYGRLRLGAFMPLWLLGAAAGLLLLKKLFSFAAEKGKQLIRVVRKKTEARYPGQMKAVIAGAVLLAATGAAAVAGCIYLYLAYLAAPLYTFTDWVPEAFLDPKAVLATAKALLTGTACAAVFRSADAAAAGIYSAWITCGCLFFTAGLCARLLYRRRAKP